MMNVICKSKCFVVTKMLLLATIFWGVIVNTTIRAEDVHSNINISIDTELQEYRRLPPVSPDMLTWNHVRDLINFVVVDPRNSRIIYATTSKGILRSIDGGENWILINDARITETTALAVDPNNTSIMYASAFIDDVGGIIKSTDSGFSWQLLIELEHGWKDDRISLILVDPNNSSIVYAADRRNIYKSADAGLNWEKIISDSGSNVILAIGSQRGSSILYTVFTDRTSSRILKSVDDGKNWIDIDGAPIGTIAVSPRNANIIYAVLSRKLYRSTNGGKSWEELKNTPYKRYDSSHRNILLTNNPNIVYLDTSWALYRSTNGGKSWREAHRGEDNRIATNLLAIDPKDPKIIYAGHNMRLYKSTNSGSTWKTILIRGQILKAEE